MALKDKIGYVEDYNIRNKEDVHPAVIVGIFEENDVKKAIKDFRFYLDWFYDNYLLVLEFNEDIDKEEILNRFEFVINKFKEIFGDFEEK